MQLATRYIVRFYVELKMSCDVYIYNSSFVAVTSGSVEIVSKDYKRRTKLCAVQNNRYISGKLYGANCLFAPGSFSYMVCVDDMGGTYGSEVICPLNGDEPGRLDVVLYPLPTTTGSGISPTTSQGISQYIARQQWSEEEKIGTRMLINALYISRSGWDPTLRYMVQRWEQRVDALGIDPGIV
jgi:hypothetical protein